VKRIAVTVVYALPAGATEIEVAVPSGTNVGEVLALSGIATRHPEIDLAAMAVGVYGVRVALDTRLSNGDRVEIYRPLQADPKDLRRRRAIRRGAD
jgi:putative ubiquitin-RnfH superfamily antitoxin RatB of RatAB toxin-antitoxin module